MSHNHRHKTPSRSGRGETDIFKRTAWKPCWFSASNMLRGLFSLVQCSTVFGLIFPTLMESFCFLRISRPNIVSLFSNLIFSLTRFLNCFRLRDNMAMRRKRGEGQVLFSSPKPQFPTMFLKMGPLNFLAEEEVTDKLTTFLDSQNRS